ncbi:MAG: hypothetical protein KDB60_20610, partial [Propionibacteriaceae bacterium]|nr:hypothetical protein [Propionibacteriaceae bacterium]
KGHEVVDYDEIAGGQKKGYIEAVENEVQRRIDRIASDPSARAIVIRMMPRGSDREDMARRIGANRVLLVKPSERICRLRAASRPSGTRKSIGLWFWRYTSSEVDEVVY